MIDWSKTDALIFDMDGTLWDAVDSYCEVWNECFRAFGVERVVMRRELVECMGLPLDEIYRRIAGDSPVISPEAYLPRLEQLEKEMMPRLGGKPYPHMRECMEQLSEHYAVFLLSNCGVNGLTDMMRHTGITPFVTEAVTFGATQRPKNENMRMLCDKYGLKQAVYVGDTEGDCQQTRLAGLPFVFAAYGFGTCSQPDLAFNSFIEMSDFFIKLKKDNEQ